jgi:transposase
MLNEALGGREQRGLAIAATQTIDRTEAGHYMVPSQSGPRRYRVVKTMDGFACACPDFELTGRTCKHGFAVEFFLRRETKTDGTVIESRAARVTYSQPSWSAYNKAQTSEKDQFCLLLKELVADVPSPEQKRGRPQLPLSDMIFAACFKVYSTVSARRFMSDLRAAAANGMIDKLPHYNSIFNVLDKESLTPILHQLIVRAALPLKSLETDFAVDSTGLGLQSFYRHFSAKYGREKERRDYLKVHALIGTKTNVIAAVAVTDLGVADCPMLPSLVTEAVENFDVQRVSADKAYSSGLNLELIESLGIQPFIPFRENTTGKSGSETWRRLFHFFQFNKDEFLKNYHRRSNIESTFSAMKRKLGDTIRSKSPVARKNEALMKVLCHNLICLIHEIEQSGAVGQFPQLAAACPRKPLTAQQTMTWE